MSCCDCVIMDDEIRCILNFQHFHDHSLHGIWLKLLKKPISATGSYIFGPQLKIKYRPTNKMAFLLLLIITVKLIPTYRYIKISTRKLFGVNASSSGQGSVTFHWNSLLFAVGHLFMYNKSLLALISIHVLSFHSSILFFKYIYLFHLKQLII